MLEIKELSYAYNAGSPDAVVALQDVTLSIAPGELVAIIGHNGSGKSTLAKNLAGILTPTSGSFSVDGIAGTSANLWEVRRRVGIVFQRPDDQLIANTVIDDVAFGPENLGLPRAEIERRVAQVLGALDLTPVAHLQISELSGGEKQRVAIAGVLTMEPSYIILDEPTTMIAPRQARQLLDLAQSLRERAGVALIHITHFMHELVGFDRVVVMDGGRVILMGTPHEVFDRADELREVGLNIPQVTALSRRLHARGLPIPRTVLTADELAAAFVSGGIGAATPDAVGVAPAPTAPPKPPETPLIEARELSFTYMADTPLSQEGLRGASCAVYEGETVALLGGTQAGKSTLIEFFNGLRRAAPGQLFFKGADAGDPKYQLGQLSDAVGVVFQQPEAQLFEEVVGKDVSFGPRRKKLAPAESRAIVEESLNTVGLDYETYRLRYIYALSGGQKRRVALAGVLAARPQVLILDEPVAGLDPRGRAELAKLIATLTRARGLTVILVGSAVDELAELADRAIVMHEGRVVLEGPLREVMGHADQLHAIGLELSEAAQIALALRAVIPGLPTDLLHIEELEEVLAQRLGLPAAQLSEGVETDGH